MLKARQIGLSETLTYDGALAAMTNRARAVYFVSVNLAASKELLRNALKWIKVVHLLNPYLAQTTAIVQESVTTVELANGSRLFALPCKEAAVRGKTGNIYLDECDHYLNPHEIWRGIAPSITAKADLRITLSSTPMGQRGLLYKIFEEDGAARDWSTHRVDVYRAIEDGHNPKVLELRTDYTENDWAQEFECAFVGDEHRYFSNEWLRRCYAQEPLFVGDSALGMDVGRINDRSAYAEILRSEGRAGLGVFDLLPQGADHVKQFDIMRGVIDDVEPDSVTVDARGEGSGLADFLASHYGSHVVQRLSVTDAYYQEAIPALKRAGERHKLYLPRDPRVAQAFGKISKTLTVGGRQVWRARRDGAGHADLFYAALYAFNAGEVAPRAAAPPASVKALSAGISKRLRQY